MADKNYYRSEFNRLIKFVKMSAICRELNIPHSNFNWFLHGRDERLSIEKCKQIYDFISNIF